MKKQKSIFLLLILMLLSSCSAQPTQAPGFIYTVVAETQRAAALQTERAESLYTKTPTPATLRATLTLEATPTVYIYVADTPTPTPSATRTPRIRTTWPDWKTGDVIRMPSGSGENIGTNKKFASLTGLRVIVARANGVVLRPLPDKSIGGPKEERGSAFTLTGVMNKNNLFGWLFAQVIAVDGNTYWVGGSEGDENTDPTFALAFYYPELTPSPTPSSTPTPTPVP